MIRGAIDWACWGASCARDAAVWGLILLQIMVEGCGVVAVHGDRGWLLNPGQIPQKDTVQYQDATKIGLHVEASGYGADVGYIKLRTTTVPICRREDGTIFVPKVTQSTAIGVAIGGTNSVADTLTIGGGE